MAGTLTGLNQRDSRWSLNIVIPPDLREAYGKRATNIALCTNDRREAALTGLMTRAEWLAEFTVKRRELKPEPLGTVTPEMARELALRVRARVLRQDEQLRDDPSTLAPSTDAAQAPWHSRVSALPIRQGPFDPLHRDTTPGAGLTDTDVETLAGLNALLNARAGAKLAKRRRAAVLPLERFEAAKLGGRVAFDPNVPGIQ